MGYDKDFEAWYAGYVEKQPFADSIKPTMYAAWQAARKDHYRIGEEVENAISVELAEVKAVLNFTGSITHINPINVRRIPARSSIDEIAEKAKDLYMATSAGDRDGLTHIIKSAILQARKEWEAER